MFLASSYASSDSGYVLTALVAVAVAMLPVFYVQNKADKKAVNARFNKQDEVLAKNTEGLAILISQNGPITASLAQTMDKTNELDRALAVLTFQVTKHEEWSGKERDEIRRKIDRPYSNPSAPRPVSG